MHLSQIPQCTIQNSNVYIADLNGALWHMGQVHLRDCDDWSAVCLSIRDIEDKVGTTANYFYKMWLDQKDRLGIGTWIPVRSIQDFKNTKFNSVLLIGIFISSCDNALRWMLQDHIDDMSTLVHIMTWGHLAANHYLSQCWPSGITKLIPFGGLVSLKKNNTR